MARIRPAAAALAGASALLLGACWPQVGQNADRTAHDPDEAGLTTDTVDGLVEAWRADVGAPTVFADGDVLTTDGGDLHRVDAATGAVRWTWTSPPDPGLGTPTVQRDPAVAGGRVLATYEVYRAGGGSGILGRALDPATGAPVPGWDRGVSALRWPVVARRSRLCPGGRCVFDDVEVVDASTSDVLLSGFLQLDDVTVGDGVLYGGSFAYDDTSSSTVAAVPLDAPDDPRCGPAGHEIFPCPRWSTPVEGEATPVVIDPDGGSVYAGTDAGHLVALDAATGALVWTTPVGAAVDHPPALAGGVLHVGTATGDLVAVDAATGGVLWSGRVAGGRSPSSAVADQPAVAGTGAAAVVYAATEAGDVTAFPAEGCGGATCAPLWHDDAGAGVTRGPTVANGTVVLGLDPDDGTGTAVAYRLG